MDMIPVSSSNMVAAGYDSSSQELTVQFHNGAYTHLGVPQYVYDGLMSSPPSKAATTIKTSKDTLTDMDTN